MRRPDRRTELLGYIASSRRLQRRLVVLAPIGVVSAIGAAISWPALVPVVIVGCLATYGVGRYITAAHIADWQLELRQLDAGPPSPISGREP